MATTLPTTARARAMPLTARMLRRNVARVSFERPLRASDRGHYRDALNPRNWTIQALGGGAAPSVRVVEPVADALLARTSTSREVPQLPVALHRHSVTSLDDERVLVCGGLDSSNIAQSAAYLFDFVKGTVATAASMPGAMANHVAQLLPDGRVLVAGGNSTTAAYLYHPKFDAWTSPPAMPEIHGGNPCAARLLDGTIAVIGGWTGSAEQSAISIFLPGRDAWIAGPTMSAGRDMARAVRMADDKIMVVGGGSAAAELIVGGPLVSGHILYGLGVTSADAAGVRYHPAVVAFNDGRVVTLGGFTSRAMTATRASAYVFDGTAWTFGGSLDSRCGWMGAAELFDGRVVWVGGADGAGAYTDDGGQVDPSTTTGGGTGAVYPFGLYGNALIPMPGIDGLAVCIGGTNSAGFPVATVRVKDLGTSTAATPSSWTTTYTARSIDADRKSVDLVLSRAISPDERLLIVASGDIEVRS